MVEDWDEEEELALATGQAVMKARSGIITRIEGPERPWGCFVVNSTSPRRYSAPDNSFIVSIQHPGGRD